MKILLLTRNANTLRAVQTLFPLADLSEWCSNDNDYHRPVQAIGAQSALRALESRLTEYYELTNPDAPAEFTLIIGIETYIDIDTTTEKVAILFDEPTDLIRMVSPQAGVPLPDWVIPAAIGQCTSEYRLRTGGLSVKVGSVMNARFPEIPVNDYVPHLANHLDNYVPFDSRYHQLLSALEAVVIKQLAASAHRIISQQQTK